MQIRAVRIVFALSFLIAIGLSFQASTEIWLPILLSFLFLVGWVLIGYLDRRGISPAWALTLAALNFVVLIPELGLRAANFHYESGVQFGWPRPRDFLAFKVHPELLWIYPPGESEANSLGFLEKEIVLPKPKNVYRILFLGDSVTEQGYPALIESRLKRETSGRRKKIECINLGISGYSSYQGRKVAELFGKRLEGDLAVVYFGWNDHWQAYGAIDSKKVIRSQNYEGWRKQFLLFYHHSRLLQWLNRKAASIAKTNRGPLKETRVPESEYVENLRRIHAVFKSNGKDVVFLTAPTSLGKVPMPSYLVERGFVPSEEACRKIHRKYNRIVRRVAKESGAHLLDLEKHFESFTSRELGTIFVDGIHFSPHGLILLSDQIAEFILEQVLVDSSFPDLAAR